MTHRRLRNCTRAALVLALVAGPVAALGSPAQANHGATTIDVGIANDGSSRNNYDDSDITVNAGTPITFFFDNGFHNVVFTSANPGGLADSPGSPGGDGVGSSYSVTPSVAGTYIYFCSIHTNAATALAATDFGADRPSEMYGRITAVADTTAPVWDAGTASATPVSASQIDLTWPTATDDSGSVQYEVYEASGATPPAKPASPATTVSGTTLSRSGLTAGVHYWYWITAVDGSGNAASPDQQADATTSSIAASASASAVVAFGVNPTLSITVTPSLLDLGTLSPAAPGTGTATVTIGSNSSWSLGLKSIGRDAVDDAAGDDAVFTDDVGQTIPVARATWDAGSGATPLSDVNAIAVTGQPAAAAADVNFAYSLQPDFTDPAGTNYRTTVLYTVTQP